MNILLTSVGRRSYLVKYFKEAVGENGEVHVSNSNTITPAFIHADKSTVSPLIYENRYIPFLLNYCIQVTTFQNTMLKRSMQCAPVKLTVQKL
jgi:carbamoyl-phosphate synthase large subunit